MRVLHFILGKANKERANGVNQVIAGLAKYTARLGADVRVIGLAESVETQGETIPRDGFGVTAYSRSGIGPLFSALRTSIQSTDIVHLHGVFSPWNLLVARICRSEQRPYVVTLHGGLALGLLRLRGRGRKALFHALVQRSHLEHAAAIHVLAEEEATEALSWCRPRRIFYVPNGVDLDDFPPPRSRANESGDEIVLGYIGRLSPEKNLEALCRAVASVREKLNVRLVLAGPDSGYVRRLLGRFSDDGTTWVGPKFGGDKSEFLRSIDVFVHPSLSDVFSITAIEVLAAGVPLLITRTAKVCYFFDRKAFFMCEPTSYGLQRGIELTVEAADQWPATAARGRALVEERLNWSAAARGLMSQYQRVLDEGIR